MPAITDSVPVLGGVQAPRVARPLRACGLDPACAPGVSHREPGGLSTRQVIDLIHTIDQPVVAADIVEYNPRCDISNLTAIVAAKLLKEIGGMMVKTNRKCTD